MNILYIHGLNSSLIPEKRIIVERFGIVTAPFIDYEADPNRIEWLYHNHKNKDIDVIIGSSMGGFSGYHLSRLLQVPALLFNPALAERSVYQNIPKTRSTNGSNLHIVLGAKDDIVDPIKTLSFLAELMDQPQDYKISIRHELEHRIPVSVFEEEVSLFFEQLTFKANK